MASTGWVFGSVRSRQSRGIMRRITGRTLLIGCLAALASACAPAGSTPATTASPVATATAGAVPTAAPTEASPLIVGIIVPFTESAINSDFGVAQQRAAELYLQQHDGMLGGRPAKLVYSDESIVGSLDTVKATQLAETEHAEVLLGLLGYDGAYAVRDYADAHHVIFIDTSASANALTRTSSGCTPSCQSPYVFRTSYSTWQLSEPLGAWAATKGLTSFDVIAADDGFGAESATAFVAGLATAGGTATAETTVSAGTDWAKVVATVAGQTTKNVYAAFAGGDAAAFITAWDQARLTAKGYKLYGPGPLADIDVLAGVGGAATGVTTSSFWSSALDNPENKSLTDLFATTYQDESGHPVAVDGYAVEMWDAMTALDLALTGTSGNPAGDALSAALEGVNFNSPRGAFAFDTATRNVIENIYIRQVLASGSGVANAVIDTIPQVSDPGK
jgi:branched-chain amino acid transport system substrate-binding protein